MTKSEYMDALRERLHRYNRALEAELLEDYEQHFAEGLAAGRTEEEIIEELGNIEDMLQEFSEEDMKQELVAVEDQASQSGSYEQIYRAVEIEGLLADVTVSASQDDQLRVDYENNGSNLKKMRYQFYQYERDGVFYAGVKERRNADFGPGASGGERIWNVFSDLTGSLSGDIYLHVQIPAGIPVVRLRNTSGDLEIRGIQTRELAAQSVSGDVQIRDVSCDRLSCHTQSGDVGISGIAMDTGGDTQIDLQTTSGDQELRRLAANKIHTRSSSGDLSAEGLRAEEMRSQTGSGEIVLRDIECGRAILRSGSGDLDVQHIRGKDLNAQTGSGDLVLRADMEACDIKTGSGDISVEASAGARQIRLAAGSGDVCLDMRSVEGASITALTGSGEMGIRGSRAHGRSCSTSYGSGACQVKIVTGSGDIQVRYAEA